MIENKPGDNTSEKLLESGSLVIIKIGGNVIDDQELLKAFLADFAAIPGRKILVHGGGKIATFIGDKLAIESKYIDGRRITDDDTIDLVTMVYGGLINKKIVAALQSFRANAIGITGADANMLPAIKRPVKEIDYGWVGDVKAHEIDAAIWRLFLDNDLIPVVAPLTHDVSGHILNTNADTMASVLSIALGKYYEVKLIYCFEKDGVLEDIDDETSAIQTLNREQYATLKENKKLYAGILPKINNAFDAFEQGVKTVTIGNSNKIGELIQGKSGTKISL